MDLLITNDQLVLLKKILTNPRHFRQYSVSFRERTPSGSVDAKKVSVLLELAAYENGSRILQLTLEALLSLFFSRLFLHYFSHLFFLVSALTRSAFSIFILFNDYFLCSKIVRT